MYVRGSGNRFPREFLDRRRDMTETVNNSCLVGKMKGCHVPTVEKLPGKAISTPRTYPPRGVVSFQLRPLKCHHILRKLDVGGAYGGRWAVRVTTRTRPRWWVRRGLQEPGLHNVCAK